MEVNFSLLKNTITNMGEEKFRMNPGVLNAIGFIGRNSWFLSLLQEIFPTEGLNLGLPHYRQTLNRLSHQGSPNIYLYIERQV